MAQQQTLTGRPPCYIGEYVSFDQAQIWQPWRGCAPSGTPMRCARGRRAVRQCRGPYQMHNLFHEPEHAATPRRLEAELQGWLSAWATTSAGRSTCATSARGRNGSSGRSTSTASEHGTSDGGTGIDGPTLTQQGAMHEDMLIDIRGLKTYFFLREGTVRAVDGAPSIRRGKTLGVVGERLRQA